MALNFFAMLYTLSIVELSLAAPRHGLAHLHRQRCRRKRYFYARNVDRRRWLAALFVCVGVILLAN